MSSDVETIWACLVQGDTRQRLKVMPDMGTGLGHFDNHRVCAVPRSSPPCPPAPPPSHIEAEGGSHDVGAAAYDEGAGRSSGKAEKDRGLGAGRRVGEDKVQWRLMARVIGKKQLI